MSETIPPALDPESTIVKPVVAVVKDPPFWVTNWFPHWAEQTLFGFPIWQWLGLLAAIFIGLLLKTITSFVVKTIKKMTDKHEESFGHQIAVALEKPLGLLVATSFWYLSIFHLQFTGEAQKVLKVITSILYGISIIWAAYKLVDILTFRIKAYAAKTESDLDDNLVPIFSKTLRIFVVVLGVLVLVQNLGFNVMSLIAGLGIGGLAVALAAQDTVANLFGSLMILIDRPFKVGDWVVTDEGEGTVEEIGFRSTRIRTFYDSVVVVPNSKIATAKIDNMGQRQLRRIKETVSLTYDTPPEKILEFIDGIEKIIVESEHTSKDPIKRAIFFDKMAASSLDINFVCFVSVETTKQEWKEKQEILLNIMRLARSLKVEFAFPTQTLHVASLPQSD